MNRIKQTMKPASFFIQTGIIDLSIDQIRRRARNLEKEGSLLVEKKKNNRGSWEWFIDTAGIFIFERIRKKKKTDEFKLSSNEALARNIHPETMPVGNIDYRIEISINFKEEYDDNYYEYFVKQFFVRNQANLYFKIEKDKDGYNHLHIGTCGILEDVKLIINHIVSKILNQKNDFYLKEFYGKHISTNVNIQPLEDNFKFQQYLKKFKENPLGDHIKFLNY